MRGLPGSGKSFIANKIYQQALSRSLKAKICSADHFFISLPPHSQYKFDGRKVPEAHAFCMNRFIEALKLKLNVIIIDNTNSKKWEYSKYVSISASAGYMAIVVEIECLSEDHVAVFNQRNEHNVPINVSMDMFNRWAPDKQAIIVPPFIPSFSSSSWGSGHHYNKPHNHHYQQHY